MATLAVAAETAESAGTHFYNVKIAGDLADEAVNKALRVLKPTFCDINFGNKEKVKNRNILKTKHGATHLEISRKITSEKIKQCLSSEISKSGQLNICRTFLFSVKCFMVRQIFLHFL